MKLSELAEGLHLERRGGDPEIRIVTPLEKSGPGSLSFVTAKKWLDRSEPAAALVVTEELAAALPPERSLLVSPAPALHAAWAALLLGQPEMRTSGIHPSAVVDETAELGEGVAVGPLAVIGARVRIGAGTTIEAGAVIHERCHIGARCRIGANSVVGAEGFGYEFVDGALQRIPHLGGVQIGDDVDIGAATTIDRARFGETRIGNGSKIDNLVQIAHNVEIGEHCIIVSQVGIAGSCRIGDGAILAGQAGLVPHVTIGPGAKVAAATGVAGDVPAGVSWSGWWGSKHRDNMAQINAVRKLPEFMKRVLRFMKHAEKTGKSESS